MNSNKVDEDTSNCPDCQLQMLQQQQIQATPDNHQHLTQTVFNDHHSSQNSSRSGHYDHQIIPSFESCEDFIVAYETRRSHSTNQNYKGSNSTTSVANSVTVSNNMTVMNSASDSLSVSTNNNPCLTPLPLEACDLKGYCATCAVLDLPNDKYYRSSLSRHSVYPPIFYGQAPPMPGFSPDIPWGNCNSNDFQSYSYNPYPPQTAASNDYYGGHNFTSTESNQVTTTSSSSSCAFSFPNNQSNCLVNENLCKRTNSQSETVTNNKGGFVNTTSCTAEEDDDDVQLPICISSSSDDSSDSGSFLSQNEVIVEDIEEEEEETVDKSLTNLCQQDQDRPTKCTVCQNPILTECNSPQLSNILENIHDEITAEDLDLSVSSGDIEIGGIEDEVVRDFNHPKKLHNNPQITISRLAYLLNVSPSIFTTTTSNLDNDNTLANFCSKCGKLCSIVDSLEKQMRIHILALKQCLQPQLRTLTSHFNLTKSSNLTSGSTESNDERNMSRIFNSSQDPICGDGECTFSQEKFSATTNMATKIQSCKVTQTESFVEKLDQSRTEPDHSKESSESTVSSTIINTQEEASVPNKSSHVNECVREEDSSGIVVVDAASSQLIIEEQNIEEQMLPVSIPLAEVSEENVIESKDEMEESFEVNNRTAEEVDCVTCDILEYPRKYYLCDECGLIITSRRTFENHFKRHHNELSFKCEICQKGHISQGALRTHLRKHTKEKPFACPRCSKSFSTKSNMNAHHEICKDNILGEKKNEFLTTVDNVSPPLVESKLQCGKCGISFRLKARLLRHQAKGCKSRTFECTRCFKKFSKSSEMKTHLLVHDNIKPFTCQICQLSFTTKGNAVSHQRTHSTEKKFVCTICNKAFNRKQALQLHHNRHNGIKPFLCDICQRKFFDPSNLQNHKKIHMKNPNPFS